MSRSRLIRGGVWLTAGNALSAGASFLRNIVIARLVSVEDFGIVILLSMTLSAIETVSNLAIDRLLIQAPDGDDPKLQASAHALQVVRGVLGGVAVYLVAEWLAALFKVPQATWAFQVLAIVPVIRSFAHLDTVRFQREMHYRPTFWVDAFPQAISLAIAVPLAYWLRDYSAIVWTMLIQGIVQITITHLLATRPYRWGWERQTVLRIFSFGWPLLVNGLLMFVIFQGDKAIVAVAFSTEVVGWYGAAFMLSMTPAMLVTSVIQSLLLPVLSSSQSNPEEFRLRYVQVVQSCLAIGLLTAAAFAIFGPELLVLLFGSPYREGTEVIILLGLTQGVRIAKAGQFVSAVALTSTKVPLIANLARGAAFFAAIALVAIGYSPTVVAITGLVGEILSYVLGMRMLAVLVRVPAIQQLSHNIAWITLVTLSWIIGDILRGQQHLMIKIIVGLAWLCFVAVAFIAVASALRAGLVKAFRGGAVGGRK
jgi:O-antigen/teichoic acid export membrane protein